MTDQRFPKSVRLRRQSEFDRVYDGNVFAADDVLVIRARRNQRNVSRLGLSVSRKVGNAVVRNRWKRLIREAFRKQRLELPGGMDLVVRPKKGATCDYRSIERSLGRLAIRLEKNLSRQPASKAETKR
jgi:ribonuclease P protein component